MSGDDKTNRMSTRQDGRRDGREDDPIYRKSSVVGRAQRVEGGRVVRFGGRSAKKGRMEEW